MKKQLSRVLALLLVLTMVTALCPLSALADEGKLVLKVDTATVLIGSSVDINVSLENNPGISGLQMDLEYDEDILTLNSVTYAENSITGLTSQASQKLTSPVKLTFYNGTANTTYNGVVATLNFTVKENIEETESQIKLTVDENNVTNIREENVPFETVNGSILAADCMPGDINNDQKVNIKDLIRLAQHLADWDVEVVEICLDTNGDGKVNIKDLIRLAQYLADWDVEIYPVCQHRKLTAIDAKKATCVSEGNVAYWVCSKCGKYFIDSAATEEITIESTVTPIDPENHEHIVSIPAVPPTETETGLSEGKKCADCGKIIVPPTPIPIDHSITYYIAGSDAYLQSIDINNPNPSYYHTGTGLVLQDLSVAGYTFEGWYTEAGEKITQIPSTATENYVLTARWSKIQNTVQFNVRMIDPEQRDLLVINKNAEGTAKNEYTSDKAWVLPTLTMDTYTFVGWSDQYGKFYTDNVIPKGTSGDLILKDNWVSQRNRAVANTKLDDPLVMEDLNNQIIYFAYDIGTIENVPLYTTQDINCVNGIVTIIEQTVSHSITEEDMQKLGTSFTTATTDSTQFELSQELTDITETTENYGKETGKKDEVIESQAKSQSSTQSFNTSSGGSSETYQYNDKTTKDATNQSYVLNTNLDSGISTELTTNVKNTTEASAGISFPIDIIKVDAGVKNTTEVSVGTDTKAYVNSSIGTNSTWDNHTYNEEYQANSTTNSAYWNTNSGYSTAQESSSSTTISEALHETISSTYGYGKTYSKTSGNTSILGSTNSSGSSTDNVTSFTYTTQDIKSTTVGLQSTGKTYGNYRLIMAGKMHVFAIVGYDIAKQDYFVYTHYVMGDGTKNDGYKEIMDYSYDRSFADWENTVIPFTVPEYVMEYVNSRTTYTEGLEYDYDYINHTATVEGYTGSDLIVYVPSYMVDSEGTAFRVTGFTADAFKGKDIRAVSLGKFITEIPDSAFEDCSYLEHIVCPRVTYIGNKAFSGCTSLKAFEIPEEITSVGTEAFKDVSEITATVHHYEEDEPVVMTSADIAENIASSGAKSIILDISGVPVEDAMNLITPEGDSLVILGKGKAFTNLTIESNATSTKLSRITSNSASGVPVKLNSENVTLYGVSISSESEFDIELLGETTELNLIGTNEISSADGKAMLCKAVNVTYNDGGKLNVSGDIYNMTENPEVNTFSNPDNRVIFSDNSPAWGIKTITADEFELYLLGEITISYDVNGGNELEIASKKAFRNNEIGKLPTPTRAYHDFDGWFTAAEGGEAVTETSKFEEDTTIYAHWTANTSIITFDANGGAVSIESKMLNVGGTVGEMPVPTRDYYSFDGWYTEKDGGTKITADTPVTDNVGYTVYAHWTEHPLSGWTLDSNVPVDAIVVENKWTYTLTTRAESQSSTMNGYQLTGSYWANQGTNSFCYSESFPGGFDSSHWIYTSFQRGPYTSYETENAKREASSWWSGYVYWHWMYNCGTGNGTSGRAINDCYEYGNDNGYLYYNFGAFTSVEGNYESDLYYCNSKSIRNYIIPERYTFDECQGATRWFRFDYYTCSYTDYIKIYQFMKTENKESVVQISASDSISNVQHWVRYRAK